MFSKLDWNLKVLKGDLGSVLHGTVIITVIQTYQTQRIKSLWLKKKKIVCVCVCPLYFGHDILVSEPMFQH